MLRRRNGKIPEDIVRVLKFANEGNYLEQLAHTIEINRSTAYTIVRANRITDLR